MQFSARIAHHELFCLTRVQRAKMPWSFPQVKASNCVTQPTDVAQQQATECEEEVTSQRSDGSEAEDDMKAKQVKLFFDADESWDCSRQHGRQVRVPPMDGAEWWQFPILEAGEYERSCLPESQTEVFKINSSYSGAMPQVPVCEALGIDAEFPENSDCNKDCHRFCQQMFKNKCGHFYRKAEHQFHEPEENKATCATPGHRQCALKRKHSAAHCWLFGPPCQPWSRLRFKKGTSEATRTPTEHPLFHCTMQDVPYIIETNDPDGGIIEQVWDGFTDEYVRPDDDMYDQAVSDARILIDQLTAQGYEVRPARMQTKDWQDVSRARHT